MIAHGRVRIIGSDDAAFAQLDAPEVRAGRESPTEWSGHAVYLRMEPKTLYTYARQPERIGA